MAITVTDVSKVYESGSVQTTALKNVTLSIENGEFAVLVGPSGSGKSTLLHVCSSLDTVTNGQIIIDGKDITSLSVKQRTEFRRNNIGFVFQQYHLIQSLTVYENIKIGFDISVNPLDIDTIIKTVGLDQKRDSFPFQLSGGEQQRVSIARALVKNPNVLFCDEPTGALDEENAKDILELLVQLNAEFGTTIMLITHNQNIGLLADKVITMNSGEIIDVTLHTKKVQVKDLNWI